MLLRKLLLPALSATTLLIAAPQSALAAESGADDALDEVVVTARKREETLLEVPIAVSAITAEEISNRGIFSITDVANNTPVGPNARLPRCSASMASTSRITAAFDSA